MTSWRTHLAMLRARQGDADSVDSAETTATPSPTGAIGAIGANGTGMESAGQSGSANAAAFYRRAAEEAMAALAEPDPDLAHERREVAAALAAEARGDFGHRSPLDGHRADLVGTLRCRGRRAL